MTTTREPSAGGRSASVRTVLTWYRAQLTGRRTTAAIPVTLSGLVLADPSGPREVDGYRPLGAIRDSLEDLIRGGDCNAAAATALRSHFGLAGYPTKDPARPLRLRVPPGRDHDRDGLSVRSLQDYINDAIRALDERLGDRRGAVGSSTTSVGRRVSPEPSTAPWFTEQVEDDRRFEMVLAAVDAARVFVATTGTSGEADEVLGELQSYELAYRGGPRPLARPAGRSRARAIVGLHLWEVIRPKPRPAAGFEPKDAGILVAPRSIKQIGGAMGAFIAGSRETGVVLGACAEALRMADQDREVANILADLLVGGYVGADDRLMSADASAAILRTVARIRAHDEDPSVVGLAWRARADYGDHWLTVDTLQVAVRVASAQEQWELAENLRREASDVLAGDFRIPDGRERAIERIEYEAWTHHQQSATLRRMAEAGAGNEPYYEGLEAADEAERCFAEAQERHQQGEPGDVSPRWGFYFAVRRAELHLAAAEHMTGSARHRHLRHAVRAREEARAVADEQGISGEAVIPLLKVDLLLALAEGNADAAVEMLWRIHRLGWPIRRSVPSMAAMASGAVPETSQPAPVRAAVRAIAEAEEAEGWSPAADDASRRRQERARSR